MPNTRAVIPFLVAMMLVTGVCNTLLTKYQVSTPESLVGLELTGPGHGMRPQLRPRRRPQAAPLLRAARDPDATDVRRRDGLLARDLGPQPVPPHARAPTHRAPPGRARRPD